MARKARQKEARQAEVEKTENSDVVISSVTVDLVWDIWPRVSQYFASFEERAKGDVRAGELLHLVLKRERQMWVAVKDDEVRACALTQMLESPHKTIILDFCSGTEAEDWWGAMVAAIEQWAVGRGSQRLVTVNRTGWTPRLKKLGYRETHRVMEKELSSE